MLKVLVMKKRREYGDKLLKCRVSLKNVVRGDA
jgi:hypothetical protein